ncbi:hypothetical protein [Burkholderia sp. HI2714]|uniref:hypothetical protein n=1 Tax=Burkholderia sp. HI2714 TaxID=2015359 RepID=UPI0015C66C27|nr:hypothetical protein [Burkholderia sp. HI2714]
MHLSIDPQMNVHQIAITEDHVCDEAGLDAVLAVDANVDCVIADGAYYSLAQTEAWSACGVLPVVERQLPWPVKRQLSWPVGWGNCRESGRHSCRSLRFSFG